MRYDLFNITDIDMLLDYIVLKAGRASLASYEEIADLGDMERHCLAAALDEKIDEHDSLLLANAVDVREKVCRIGEQLVVWGDVIMYLTLI